MEEKRQIKLHHSRKRQQTATIKQPPQIFRSKKTKQIYYSPETLKPLIYDTILIQQISNPL